MVPPSSQLPSIDAAIQSLPSPALVDASDDHATLHAALAFVDEYELSDGESAFEAAGSKGARHSLPHQPLGVNRVGEVNPQPGDAESVAAPNRSSTNRSRTRQKDELVYLRGVVEELENELLLIKKGDATGADDDAAKPDHSEPLAFVWEELAARQYTQRQRAEVENVKLRTMLEEQTRVAKNLERLIKKRTMAEFLVPLSAKRVRKWKESSALDDPAVFDELDATMTEMHAEVDKVFADERFACKSPSVREVQARNDDEFGTIVEVFDSRVGPFSVEDISEAVWHHMTLQGFDPHAFHDQVVDVTESAFKREFGSIVDMPRMKGTFRGKIAGRRIVQDDRVLVLWAALLDPEKIAEMPMDGLLMRQRGWTLIRPSPPDFVRSGKPATFTQSYHMMIPDLSHEEEGDQRRKVGTLTNFVLSSVDFHLEMGRQMVENLLLEDGWKTPLVNAQSPAISEETRVVGKQESAW